MSEEERPFTAAAEDFVRTINEGLNRTTERFLATVDYIRLHSNNVRAVAIGIHDLHNLFHEASNQATLAVIKEFFDTAPHEEATEHLLAHGTQIDLTHEYRNLCTFLSDRLDWYEIPDNVEPLDPTNN